MDLTEKEQLKWKFYRLVLILDLVILLVAVGVIAFFLAPPERRIPIIAVMILVAGMMSIYFWRKYRETKQWLKDRTGSPEGDDPEPAS